MSLFEGIYESPVVLLDPALLFERKWLRYSFIDPGFPGRSHIWLGRVDTHYVQIGKKDFEDRLIKSNVCYTSYSRPRPDRLIRFLLDWRAHSQPVYILLPHGTPVGEFVRPHVTWWTPGSEGVARFVLSVATGVVQ